MKKIVVYIALIVSIQQITYPQQLTITLDNKSYSQENNKWYVTNFETGEKFLVNTHSITVKLEEEISKTEMIKQIEYFGLKIKRENILGYMDLELPENSSFIEVYNNLKNTGLFDLVEINSFGEMLGEPNDPRFGYQYHLNHPTRPDINAPEGWGYLSNFGYGITIAIIDQGVYLYHPDLSDNIWWPYGGYDYIAENYPDPAFGEDHGTHVAGIAAARTNNTIGVAGVAGGWDNPGAKIMALRVIEQVNPDSARIESDAVDDAILFAALNGAKIINMSFRVDELSAIKDAIDFAYNTRGCLLIAAAGNDPGETQPYFPARDNAVMAVAGLKWKNWDHLGNTGYQIYIAVPAEEIYSTTYSGPPDLKYGNSDGTSHSAPQVSGAAALIWADYPDLINFDIKNILKNTAYTDFPTYSSLKFGSGLLKVDQALIYAFGLPDKPTGITINAPIGSHPTISWNPVLGADYYIVYRSELGKRLELSIAATTTNLSWTDNMVIVAPPKFQKSYYYRVAAVDNNYESPVSAEVSCNSNTLWKDNVDLFTSVRYEYILYENYPNPFNPSTTIRYSLKEAGLVRIKVYDILGREVTKLANEIKQEGEHTVDFRVDNLSAGRQGLPSGVYFYAINSGSFRESKKMILMR